MATDDPHHRRIDLQSPSDLTYLHHNIRRAAAEKLDLAFPPRAAPEGEEDALRVKAEALVQEVRPSSLPPLPLALFRYRGRGGCACPKRGGKQYIAQTLTLALPSLSVNGLDAAPALLQQQSPTTTLAATDNNPPAATTVCATKHNPDHTAASASEGDANYEPYDPRLATRLRTLYAALEFESTRVAQLRRSAPSAAARSYIDRVQTEIVAERDLMQKMSWEHGEEGAGVGGDGGVKQEGVETGLGVGLERREEVEKIWGRGVEGLIGLGAVTEVVARLERAARAVGVVEGV